MTKAYNKCIGTLVFHLSILILNFNNDLKYKYETLKSQISNHSITPLPEVLLKGLIIMEDKRFYDHSGFDVHAIIRSLKNNIRNKTLQGASTIEQQLVRTITNQREISKRRKVREIIFATLISKEFGKNTLLSIYLNIYPFRHAKGVCEFCKNENYNLNDLTIYDVSEIVARIKYPSINSNNYLRYLKRARTVQMKLQ